MPSPRNRQKDIVVIGGSAGSINICMMLLQAVPEDFDFTIVLVLHRLRNVRSDMSGLLSAHRKFKIRDVEDKDIVRNHCVYLAPQNYHLLVEDNHTFALDYSEPVHFCRPSIDVTFESMARAYGPRVTAILLSGANQDGASGISAIVEAGGKGIVQDPDTADYPAMPMAAIQTNESVEILTPEKIVDYIRALNH